jgi:hypothetical protein
VGRSPFTWAFLRRRGPLLAAGFVVGVLAAYAISGLSISATCALSVETTGDYQPPYQQSRLALTYARLLPEDPEVIATTARYAGLSRDFVRDHLAMKAEPDTNIVYARFTAGDAGTATRGLEGVLVAMRTAEDAAGTPLRETMTQLTEPNAHTGVSRKRALAVGGLLGLVAALGLALAFDRRRPRVDELSDLAALVPLPVSEVRPDGLAAARVSRTLVVDAGTPVAEVVEASRAAAAAGRAPVAALLVRRPRWSLRRGPTEATVG